MDSPQINHLSLCAGYGGIDLGLRSILPNVRTVAYVEIEAFAAGNLVEKMESKQLDEAPLWTNLKTFDAKPFRGMVDIVSGGFPCQPFSHAGQQKSTDDPRHLFPDIERIVLECEPRIIFFENVEGIISSKLGGEPDTSVLKHVLGRMESMGYRSTAGIFSAEEVGAPHRRKRVFLLGISNNDGERFVRKQEGDSQKNTLEEQRWDNTDRQRASELANPDGDSCRQGEPRRATGELQQEGTGLRGGESEGQTGQESGCCCSTDRELGNPTGHGRDKGGTNKEAGRTDRCCKTGRVQKSSGGCCKLGNTKHNGSSDQKRRGAAKTSERNKEGANTTLQSSGTSRSEIGGDLQGELGNTSSEGLERHTGNFSGKTATKRKGERHERLVAPRGLFPSKPNEQQQDWEAPRTIGDEETITAMGGSDYGIADGDMVRSCRVDSLRLLGNGVVPMTAAKAFVCLVHDLNET